MLKIVVVIGALINAVWAKDSFPAKGAVPGTVVEMAKNLTVAPGQGPGATGMSTTVPVVRSVETPTAAVPAEAAAIPPEVAPSTPVLSYKVQARQMAVDGMSDRIKALLEKGQEYLTKVAPKLAAIDLAEANMNDIFDQYSRLKISESKASANKKNVAERYNVMAAQGTTQITPQVSEEQIVSAYNAIAMEYEALQSTKEKSIGVVMGIYRKNVKFKQWLDRLKKHQTDLVAFQKQDWMAGNADAKWDTLQGILTGLGTRPDPDSSEPMQVNLFTLPLLFDAQSFGASGEYFRDMPQEMLAVLWNDTHESMDQEKKRVGNLLKALGYGAP